MTRQKSRFEIWIAAGILFACVSYFAAGCLPTDAYAGISVRVLLMDNKDLKVPAKEECLTRMGATAGDVLLSGLKYSGVIEVWKGDKGLYVINDIPLEDYIKGVVTAEMKSSWDIEALKAQAVAARTLCYLSDTQFRSGGPI